VMWTAKELIFQVVRWTGRGTLTTRFMRTDTGINNVIRTGRGVNTTNCDMDCQRS